MYKRTTIISLTMQSLLTKYKHLYEIRSIQRVEFDEESNQITDFVLAEPMVNSYNKGANVKLFINTKKVIIMSNECPDNILDMLSLEELHELLTEKEYYDLCHLTIPGENKV